MATTKRYKTKACLIAVCLLKRYVEICIVDISHSQHIHYTYTVINWLVVVLMQRYSSCVCVWYRLSVHCFVVCCAVLWSKWFRNSWMAFLIWFEKKLISKKSHSLLFYSVRLNWHFVLYMHQNENEGSSTQHQNHFSYEKQQWGLLALPESSE